MSEFLYSTVVPLLIPLQPTELSCGYILINCQHVECKKLRSHLKARSLIYIYLEAMRERSSPTQQGMDCSHAGSHSIISPLLWLLADCTASHIACMSLLRGRVTARVQERKKDEPVYCHKRHAERVSAR